jgi:hypothetical protein
MIFQDAILILVLPGKVTEKRITDKIRYIGSSSPSTQIATPQRVNTIIRGSTSDSKINRILSRDKAIPEALRTELLALDLCDMTRLFMLKFHEKTFQGLACNLMLGG